jgi:glycosyltransferase involved in cell wall biosynthesis
LMAPAEAVRAPRLLYVQYANPAAYPPLLHSIELFAEAGCRIDVLGLDRRNREFRPIYPRQVRVRLLPTREPGWQQKAHYVRFMLRALAAAVRFRPDWLYASDALSTPIARMLGTCLAVQVLYHEHDRPTEGPEEGNPSWFMRRIMHARAAVVRRAAMCIVPNERRAEALRSELGRSDVTVVWNCPRIREVPPVARTIGRPGMRVSYHGSIVPARLPLAVIEALAQLPADVHLIFAGYETEGHRGYIGSLLARARDLGLQDRVQYAGVLTREALLELCATCDVGLSLLPTTSADPNESAMAGASNKAFEYLACGVPLVVGAGSDWRLFEEAGVAVVCDSGSPLSIAAALRTLRDDPARRVAMGARGRQRVLADWNYDVRFAPVLAALTGRSSLLQPEHASVAGT